MRVRPNALPDRIDSLLPKNESLDAVRFDFTTNPANLSLTEVDVVVVVLFVGSVDVVDISLDDDDDDGDDGGGGGVGGVMDEEGGVVGWFWQYTCMPS